MKYTKEYLIGFGNEVFSQIICGVGEAVVMSWGVREIAAAEVVGREGYVCPSLVLHVSGLIHTGLVVVALNEGTDTYEIQLRTSGNAPKGDWLTDVYCDELGRRIDALVERPSDMSDEDYERLSTLDSFLKQLLEK